MKFCLKTFETCLLLYVSVLECSILAISLFKYEELHPSARRGKDGPGEERKKPGGQLLPYFPRLWKYTFLNNLWSKFLL